jgi:pimeloyl-ACP methyl ester carboxylesterase
MRPYLDAAEKAGQSKVVAIGEAREFRSVFDATKKDGADGVPWFRLYRTERLRGSASRMKPGRRCGAFCRWDDGYRRVGAGPAVVLLHGAGQSPVNLMRLARALSGSFTVYVPDRRGRGTSGPYGGFRGLGTEIEDLSAPLDACGATRLFGLSGGSASAPTTTPRRSPWNRSAAGGRRQDGTSTRRPGSCWSPPTRAAPTATAPGPLPARDVEVESR